MLTYWVYHTMQMSDRFFGAKHLHKGSHTTTYTAIDSGWEYKMQGNPGPEWFAKEAQDGGHVSPGRCRGHPSGIDC